MGKEKLIVYAWNLPAGGLFKTICEELRCFGRLGEVESIYYYASIPVYYRDEFQQTNPTIISKKIKENGLQKQINNSTSTLAFTIPANAFIKTSMVIHKRKPSIVIVHELGSAFTLFPFLLANRDKVVLVLHDNPFSFFQIQFFSRHPIIKIILRFSIKSFFILSKYVICTTNSIKMDIEKYGIKGNIKVADYGVNNCPEKVKYNTSRTILVLTKWTVQRKPNIYIEIAKNLGNRYEFIIAGHWDDPKYLEEIKNQIDEANKNGSSIRLVLDPSEREAHLLYHESILFLRLSFDEHGTGQGILDAIGHGMPLVLGNGMGALSGIENGKHAIFVNSNEPFSVAQEVKELLSNSELWNKLSKNNISLSFEYTWEKYCNILLEGKKEIIKIIGDNNRN